MNNDLVDEAYQFLEDYGVSVDVLDTVLNINGYTMETIDQIVYAIYGYQSYTQLTGEDDE